MKTLMFIMVLLFGFTELSAQKLALVIYKREKILEVWSASSRQDSMQLFKTYPILAVRPQLGPKRREGDGMTPEGLYKISLFNPHSAFHKSMKIDYPNPWDREHGEKGNLGGDIFIHGKNVTAGCIAIGDSAIDELYALCKKVGVGIPVLILPSNTRDTYLSQLTKFQDHDGREDLYSHFGSLLLMMEQWQQSHRVPKRGFLLPGGWKVD